MHKHKQEKMEEKHNNLISLRKHNNESSDCTVLSCHQKQHPPTDEDYFKTTSIT